MTDPAPTPGPPARARATAPGRGCLLVAAASLVVALGAAALLLARPTVVFTNGLLGPVRLVVNDAARTVAPGETVRGRVSRDMLVAQWELVRPLSADGAPMGEELRGSWVVREPRGTVERRAGARLETGDYFAPLITNASDRLLRITVNAGLHGAVDCRCAVRPGASRVFIGYYRLYRNSTVRAAAADGRTATFADLGAEALARGLAPGLRFASGNFR